MSDWRDKIKAARLPEATVAIVTRSDLVAEHESITRQLVKAGAMKATSLAGTGSSPLKERLLELEAEMVDSILELRLRALPRVKRPGDTRPTWAEFKAQFPPREKDGEILRADLVAGSLNVEAIAEPLAKISVVEPDDMTEEDWADFLPGLSEKQFDDIVSTAWALNESRIDIPFSSAGSETTPTS
jgi:hypothetical protein